jgi:hypothetical protein
MGDLPSMINKTKSATFTRADIGTHVVFAGFDGGSYSATIVEVHSVGYPLDDQTVRVAYRPAGPEFVYATVKRADWFRLTRFAPTSKFMALEVL